MRARMAFPVLCLMCTLAAAGGEPKPSAIDVKAIKDKLLLIEDAQGGTSLVLPRTEVARDTAGEVYSTKSGDVRFVIDTGDSARNAAFWIKGEKKSPLSILDVDANSRIIWGELGIYTFLGTPCDEL